MSGDDESMRLAFEQYMLGGSGSTTTPTAINTKSREEIKAEQEAKEEETRRAKVQAEIKKAEKIYWHTFKRFGNRLKDEWLDIDDQAYQVIQSIAGIRKRLPSESKMVGRYKDVVQKKNWACYGFRRVLVEKGGDIGAGGGTLLTEEDVELALSHDLIQHEKMMSALRSLFAQLSECHEALLRMLDEMMKHELRCSETFHWGDLSERFHRASSLKGIMSDLLSMLSLELYRKQCMVHQVLERVRDDLLRSKGIDHEDQENDLEWEDLGPQGVVDRCSRLWPRDCKESHIKTSTLKNALNLIQ